MKHYGIWVKEVDHGEGDVSKGFWMSDHSSIIFCTTSKAHAVAQLRLWKYGSAEVKEFQS